VQGRPHPFFWATVLPTLPAGAAAVTLHGPAPAVALGSTAAYRAEVALVVFAVGYVITLLLWMAYHGQSAHIELPGGTSIDPTTARPLESPAPREASAERKSPARRPATVSELERRARS
jgi:hypothetical protein